MTYNQFPLTWAFESSGIAVVVQTDDFLSRLDKDPMPDLGERERALALAALRLCVTRLERQEES